jgi:hypothetical protein
METTPNTELSNIMLKTDDFPAAHLGTLTEQINNWLGDMIQTGQLPPDENNSGAAPTAYELGEQFLMFSMKDPQEYAESSDPNLSKLLMPTGRRHHQLKYKQKAIAYARSLVDQNESLCQLFATKLAPSIQEATAWLDDHETEFDTGSWRVRLVTIPTFHTHAFLIQELENGSDVTVGDSYVFVVSRPKWLDKLPKRTLLTPGEFLLGFKDKTPIIGIDTRPRH